MPKITSQPKAHAAAITATPPTNIETVADLEAAAQSWRSSFTWGDVVAIVASDGLQAAMQDPKKRRVIMKLRAARRDRNDTPELTAAWLDQAGFAYEQSYSITEDDLAELDAGVVAAGILNALKRRSRVKNEEAKAGESAAIEAQSKAPAKTASPKVESQVHVKVGAPEKYADAFRRVKAMRKRKRTRATWSQILDDCKGRGYDVPDDIESFKRTMLAKLSREKTGK